MHQISNQQLIKHIPKKLPQWNFQDVYKWLTLNHVNIDLQKLRENKVDGLKMMRMEIKQWREVYGLSKFISGQILDWLDEQALEFQALLKDDSLNKKIGRADGQDKQKQEFDDERQIPQLENRLNHWQLQQITRVILKPSQTSQTPSSQQELSLQQKQQYSTSEPPLAQQQHSSQQDHNSSQYQSNQSVSEAQNESSNSELESDIESKVQIGQNMEDNVEGDGNMSDNEQIDAQTQEVEMDMEIQRENTQRIHKKIRTFDKSMKKQSKVVYDQANGIKMMKKKKDQSKAFNERLKGKNNHIQAKEVKNQSSVNAIEKIKQNSSVKRLNSPQEFPAQVKPLVQKVEIIKNKNKNYKLQSPHVKFVATELMYSAPEVSKNINTFQKKLKIKTQNFEAVVIGNAKIGRAKGNLVLFEDESVSRNHAEITPNFTYSGKIRFLLKDVGSRFGTYVQCRGQKQINIGKSYLIGCSQVQILTVELVKPYNCSQLSRNKTTFNIKLRLDKQKILSFSNKLHVSIGKGNSTDVKIDNVCNSAKIWLEKEKKIMIEGIDGKLYEKLVQNSQWDIQRHLDTFKQVQVIFGWLKTTFQVIETCVVCSKTPEECQCKK